MSGSGTSPPINVRDFEAALRGLGYSRAQAKAISSEGFKAFSDEAESDFDTESKSLEELVAQMKRVTLILER